MNTRHWVSSIQMRKSCDLAAWEQHSCFSPKTHFNGTQAPQKTIKSANFKIQVASSRDAHELQYKHERTFKLLMSFKCLQSQILDVCISYEHNFF